MSVTSPATPPATIPTPPPPPPPPTKAPRWVEPLLLTSLLTCTAVLYLWDLSISGWGNTYYAAAAQAGATILPASPGFYTRPKTIDDLLGFVTQRVLDLLGIEGDRSPRWKD